ncbi:hypothetical protein RRG08_023809 [Elysia crispata]|uniref:Uncharacterized protein n=1 Tax=Elysia crispata TaxID=231223 RepID=A0AAE0ZXJ7_9GAST|nr:hypothetical protein RRG08_023809 [Elysia crispata]
MQQMAAWGIIAGFVHRYLELTDWKIREGMDLGGRGAMTVFRSIKLWPRFRCQLYHWTATIATDGLPHKKSRFP